MSSKIRSEIEKLLDTTQEKGEDAQKFFKRLARGVGELGDADFDSLSAPAQDWYNAACDAADARKDIVAFADEQEDEAPKTRRRKPAAAEPEKEAPAAYEPKAGDKVKYTSKRGKVTEGTFVEIDGDDYVIDDGKEELLVPVSGSIESAEPPKEETTSRRRKAAEPEDEPEEPQDPQDPQVGDTLECTNKRGKVYTGELLEDIDGMLIIKTDGGEEELAKDRLDKVTILKRAKAAAKAETKDEPTSSRRKPAADKEDAADKPKGKVTKDDNDGVSVTTRVAELVTEDFDLSYEDVEKQLKKEGLVFREATIKLNYKQVHKIIALLKAAKKLK